MSAGKICTRLHSHPNGKCPDREEPIMKEELPIPTKPEKTHPWIYVIIPMARHNNEGTDALFCAFCKDCRYYFTEEITASVNGKALMWPSKLPRTGCGDEVADEGFSSLPGVDR